MRAEINGILPESTIIGAFVSPDNVLELVLSPAVVTAAIGEEEGGATHAEVAIRDEHRAFLAGVPIEPNHFSANHQSVVIRVSLEHVTGQVKRYHPSTAPHPSQLTTRTPTSFGRTRVFSNTSSIAPNITVAASSRPNFMVAVFSGDPIDFGTFEACKIKEINRSRLGHEVNREGKHKNHQKRQDGGQIVLRSAIPKLLPHLRPAKAPNLRAEHRQQQRHGGQVYPVADQIMVPQFHVLQVHRLHEVRQPSPDPDGERHRTGIRPRRLDAAVHDLRRQEVLLFCHALEMIFVFFCFCSYGNE
nr:hypothetical protein Ccrd_026623 [Ipomoea batatas]